MLALLVQMLYNSRTNLLRGNLLGLKYMHSLIDKSERIS